MSLSSLPKGDPSGAPALRAHTALDPGRYPGFYGDDVGVDADDAKPLRRYFQLLQKHWKLIGGVIAAFLMAGLAVSFFSPRAYTATTSIQIDREAARVFRSQDGASENAADPQFYATQYELLKSRALAERVVASLALANNAEFLGSNDTSVLARLVEIFFAPRTDGETEAQKKQGRAVDLVMRDLTVQPVPMSRIVKVSFTSRDPATAQRVSAAIGENFVAMSLDRRFSASSYARKFLEEKLQQAKAKLEDLERQMVAYAQREGIVDVDDKMTISGANMRSLNDSLAAATSERIKAEELWIQAQNSTGADLPQVLGDKLIERAREKRTELMADYQDKLKLMKPDFPEMKQLRAQIGEFDRQIHVQVDLIKRSIKSQYDAAREQEASFGRKLAEMKNGALDLRNRSIQYNILKRELDTNRSLYDGLLLQYKEVGVTSAVNTNNVSIIDKAAIPKRPSSPNLLLNLLISLALGLIAAMIAVLVREHFDDGFETPDDVESQLGLSTFGVVPLTILADRSSLAREVISKPMSEINEAFRSLRTSLQFSTPTGAPKVLLVTSAQPQEGKSTTSISLAANFAQLGERVLLIDGDLRSPTLHQQLGVDNSLGLSHVLSGARKASEVLRHDIVQGVSFMSAGIRPPNPTELLATAQFNTFLDEARRDYGVVIIDAPPVLGLADAVLLGGQVDGALLVIEAGRTRRKVVAWALKRLFMSRTPVIGAVLNKFDAQKFGRRHDLSLAYGLGYGAPR